MNLTHPAEQQRRLVESFRHAISQAGGGGPAEMIETHISWVILAGEFAYKIKKAVDFGFLDYSTLALRHRYCLEELRLNRRTAPHLYLDIIGIGGDPAQPFATAGEAAEWAVKMKRFPQEALLDRRLQSGGLTLESMDDLARALAEFHGGIPAASADTSHGEPEEVYRPMAENFPPIRATLAASGRGVGLDAHEAWTKEKFNSLIPRLQKRKAEGFVRECHGDLHLGNILQMEGRFVPFDAIEFNPHLRFIDVANELAFLAMDLQARGQPAYAARVANGYLELTGDYEAVALLDFYTHYRAMVRAKVAALRLAQPALSLCERLEITEQFGAYLTLARQYLTPPRPALILTHGLSGSGKSRIAGALVEHLPRAIRLRSDVERKRLFGIDPLSRSHASLATGLYGPEATSRTYARLNVLAREVIEGGHTAIVDATFLRQEERANMHALARELGIPFLVVSVTAPEEVLRERILARLARSHDASDADLEVLAHQLKTREALSDQESAFTLCIESAEPWEGDAIAERVAARLWEKEVNH